MKDDIGKVNPNYFKEKIEIKVCGIKKVKVLLNVISS